jgi:hypothetical protein
MVSGLHVASAILTKYKGPNDEKATLRPYTPISDESKLLSTRLNSTALTHKLQAKRASWTSWSSSTPTAP